MIRLTLTILLSITLGARIASADEGNLGRLYRLGEGLAQAVMIGHHPIRIEKFPANEEWESFERRTYFLRGIRVVALKFKRGDSLVVASVNARSIAALRRINHDFPRLTREDLIGQYGTPKKQSEYALQYQALSEMCEEFIEIGLKKEKMISLKWDFCFDSSFYLIVAAFGQIPPQTYVQECSSV